MLMVSLGTGPRETCPWFSWGKRSAVPWEYEWYLFVIGFRCRLSKLTCSFWLPHVYSGLQGVRLDVSKTDRP